MQRVRLRLFQHCAYANSHKLPFRNLDHLLRNGGTQQHHILVFLLCTLSSKLYRLSNRIKVTNLQAIIGEK